MKKLVLTFILVGYCLACLSQKKVLLEEFTGAYCSNCPMGSYYVDSMAKKYANVIPVALHAYAIQDSMASPAIDTIGIAYAPGAPLGAINRKYLSSISSVAQPYILWDASIQQELLVSSPINIMLSSTWNSATRTITANMNVQILTNIAAGDYRMSLYIVEDSVIKTGPGYDQDNAYTTVAGNPFYGMGDPIAGFIHRHVARAILPSAWGLPGVLPAAPLSGATYSHTFTYTLPSTINAGKVHLVGFVSSYTSNHQGDSVLNATEQKLSLTNEVPAITGNDNVVKIYPNPNCGIFTIIPPTGTYGVTKYLITNAIGTNIKEFISTGNTSFDLNLDLPAGVYFVTASSTESRWNQRIVLTNPK